MRSKLYVGNLPWATTADELLSFFSSFNPSNAKIIIDRETGRSRGFGFIEVEGPAAEAISSFDGVSFNGRTLRVNEAVDKRRIDSAPPRETPPPKRRSNERDDAAEDEDYSAGWK